MKISSRQGFLAAFIAIFAILAAYVFWGTWSCGVSAVMPDDAMSHPLSMAAQSRGFWHNFLRSGCIVPGDLFWGGLAISRYVVQELKYAASAFFAALALAYFLKGRGLSRVAAYGGGLLLGFCGYWLTLFSAGHYGWFAWMTYGVFAFGLIDRAFAKGKVRHWLFLGATVAWASFNQPDLWLLFTAFTAIYFIFVAIRSYLAKETAASAWFVRFAKGMALAAIAFVLIGAPSVKRAFADALVGRAKQLEEAKGTALGGGEGKSDAESKWIFATNWSMPPEDTLEFFIPRIHGDTSCPMTLQLGRAHGKAVKPYDGRLGRPLGADRGNYRQHSLYVGFITCALALLGIIGYVRKRAEVAFFAIAALVFWVFSMGRFCECVYRLVYALPFGDYLRAPVKWHHLTEFCLVVLAGYGLEFHYERLRKRSFSVVTSTVIVALIAVLGAADLARVDKLYCAPVDLSIVRNDNSAAQAIRKAGGGGVVDMVEGGRGLVAWSFAANEVPVVGISDANARFVFASVDGVRKNRQLAEYLSANAAPVGYYMLTRSAIRGANASGANAVLFQRNGIVPAAEPPPVVDRLAVALGCVSVGFSLLLILFVGIPKLSRLRI